MNIVVGSAFRNFGGRVRGYLNQVVVLQHYLGDAHQVRVLAVEGDSTDNTRTMLTMLSEQTGVPLELVTCNHGGRVFGSTEDTDRFVALSKVGNAIFSGVRDTDDVLFYVECDLLWDASTAWSLIEMAARRHNDFDVFAPYVAAGKSFYDIWAFRMADDERFSPFYEGKDAEPFGVYSAGSCLTMRADVAREIRITDDYCLVGWCRNARAAGYHIACAPMFRVNHP